MSVWGTSDPKEPYIQVHHLPSSADIYAMRLRGQDAVADDFSRAARNYYFAKRDLADTMLRWCRQ